MEYARTKNHIGETYQWADSQTYMVLDMITGKPERFGSTKNSCGGLQDAIDYVSSIKGCEDRLIIVPMPCIRAFKI
jgi:hypothetical protein